MRTAPVARPYRSFFAGTSVVALILGLMVFVIAGAMPDNDLQRQRVASFEGCGQETAIACGATIPSMPEQVQ